MPKVTFHPYPGHDAFGPDTIKTIEVPAGTSILRAAQKAEAQVGFACGGNCACSTCHVYVREGYDSLSDIEEKEEDILDKAFDVRPVSRLGCQAKLGDEDVVCEITRESRQAWFDEHPDAREHVKAQQGSSSGS
jgi:2Fe-2S ferredoxin